MPRLLNPFAFGGAGSTLTLAQVTGIRVWCIATHLPEWDVSAIEAASTPGGPNVLTGGTASGNAMASFANAFDGNNATAAGSSSSDPNYDRRWLAYVLPAPVALAELRIRPHTIAARSARAFIVHVTYDYGLTWLPVQVYFPGNTWAVGTTRAFVLPTERQILGSARADARFWRWNQTANNGSTVTRVSEIEFRATVGGPDLCTGGSAFASSQIGGDFDAQEGVGGLTDNNLTNVWSNGDVARFGYAFAAPTNVGEATIRNWDGAQPIFRDGTLDWSVDFATWNVALTPPAQTGWALFETRAFAVP
jgi:hypothetical protein